MATKLDVRGISPIPLPGSDIIPESGDDFYVRGKGLKAKGGKAKDVKEKEEAKK